MWKKWLHLLLVWAVASVALSLAALNGQAAAAAITVGTNQTTVGSTVLVELTGTNLSGLQGLQLSLQWDTNKLEYVAITSASLPFFGTAHVGTNAILNGKLGIAWDDVTGVGVALTNGVRLFSVQFVIKGGAGTTSAISIADVPTAVEVLINNTASRPNVFAGWVSIDAAAGTPPGLTAQPTNLVVNATSNATFSVTATGTALLAYQWVKNGVALGSATNASLVLSNVQTNQAGAYTVVITNAYGSVTSSVAVLTVNRLAQAITFAALPGKQVGDAPFALTATASSSLSVSFTIASGPATISGSTITLTGAGTVVVRASQAGNATYNAATPVDQSFTVSAAPPSAPVITSAATGSATVGQAFTYTITANNSPTGFNATGLPAGLSVNTGTGVISGTPTAAGTSTMTLSASNAGGTGSQTLTLTVAPVITIAITTQPRDQTVVVGANVTFTVNAVGQPPLTYQWRRETTDLPSATSSSLVLNAVTLAQGGAYRVVVTDAVGNLTSAPAQLVVTTSLFQPPAPQSTAAIRSQGFGLNLLLETGRAFRVQASSNMLTWSDLTNFVSTGAAFQFIDAAATNQTRRFYRVVSP